MHLKMRFQMHLKNAFKRWEIFPKGRFRTANVQVHNIRGTFIFLSFETPQFYI